MKKIRLALCVVPLLASTAVFMYRERIGMVLAFARLQPATSFAATLPPPAREYSDAVSWAALPDGDDAADVVHGAGVQDLQSSAPVDVFFVHSTTYYKAAKGSRGRRRRQEDELLTEYRLAAIQTDREQNQ